ncbi:MAG: prepilin-type N-terminal cleavage/methylation domain-containing protein [Candidatus Gracilibacteria bacterium]|nr:prepilin-type N-terminal cleavage/methylation domain-containing protein [Candidatus Gracilibacteria bacterium]
MKKNNKAFTLVELIVVITILAILGTIAFINLQGYSTSARDGKRVSDINNIMKKIGIEISKGTSLSSLINTTKTNSGLTINSQVGSSIQGTANFLALKEDGNSFKDPITNGDYVLSYGVGGTGTGAYKFSQISTINEELNQAVVKGNYYLMKTGDSPSILKNNNDNFIVDEGVELPYEIIEGTPVVANSCDTQPSYTNASFTTGTPTSENQIWQNVNNANPCYYECINGYTGASCEISPFVCGDTLSVDGYTYNTYLLSDGKCWTSTMKHGDKINYPLKPSNDSIIEKICYNNDLNLCNSDGAIYTWAEAMGFPASCNSSNCSQSEDMTKSVCGKLGSSWHLPSATEWNNLKGLGVATGWTGNKIQGIISQLGGYYHPDGNFYWRGSYIYLHTSTQNPTSSLHSGFIQLVSSNANINYYDATGKDTYGGFVVCIK